MLACKAFDPCTVEGLCGANSQCTRTGDATYNCTCLPGFNSTTGANCTLYDGSLTPTPTTATPTTSTFASGPGSSASAALPSSALGGIVAGAVAVVLVVLVAVLVLKRRSRAVDSASPGSGKYTGPIRKTVENPVYRGTRGAADSSAYGVLAPGMPAAAYSSLHGAGQSVRGQAGSYNRLSRDGDGFGRGSYDYAHPGLVAGQGTPQYDVPAVHRGEEETYDLPKSRASHAGEEAYDLPKSRASYVQEEPYDLPKSAPAAGGRLMANQAYSDHEIRRPSTGARLMANQAYSAHEFNTPQEEEA